MAPQDCDYQNGIRQGEGKPWNPPRERPYIFSVCKQRPTEREKCAANQICVNYFRFEHGSWANGRCRCEKEPKKGDAKEARAINDALATAYPDKPTVDLQGKKDSPCTVLAFSAPFPDGAKNGVEVIAWCDKKECSGDDKCQLAYRIGGAKGEGNVLELRCFCAPEGPPF